MIRCKLRLASNWPPNSSVASKNQLFPQWQAQRTFLGRSRAKSVAAARLCGFFHRPPTAPIFHHLLSTSTMRQFLKIRWANHPCGFDPRHRHHPGACFCKRPKRFIPLRGRGYAGGCGGRSRIARRQGRKPSRQGLRAASPAQASFHETRHTPEPDRRCAFADCVLIRGLIGFAPSLRPINDKVIES